jgi:phosphatidylglycerol:prolipoprotein diacylglycerol transferase
MTINIDPVLLSLGPIQVRWYGLMYVFGFLVGGKLLAYLSDKKYFRLPKDKIDSLITYVIVGMFLGARSFYVFIYNWDYYSNHLTELLAVWQGGLSFHGALVGISIAGYIFAKKHKLHFFELADAFAIAGSPGLFFGRMGNFINGELYGRVTDVPWGFIFNDGGPYPRHPSQLYEGILEGIILFSILFMMHSRVKIYGKIGACFVFGYGVMRFIVEFFREPDSQLGYYFDVLTMGQILCLFMMAVGVVFYILVKKKNLEVSRT